MVSPDGCPTGVSAVRVFRRDGRILSLTSRRLVVSITFGQIGRPSARTCPAERICAGGGAATMIHEHDPTAILGQRTAPLRVGRCLQRCKGLPAGRRNLPNKANCAMTLTACKNKSYAVGGPSPDARPIGFRLGLALFRTGRRERVGFVSHKAKGDSPPPKRRGTVPFQCPFAPFACPLFAPGVSLYDCSLVPPALGLHGGDACSRGRRAGRQCRRGLRPRSGWFPGKRGQRPRLLRVEKTWLFPPASCL